MREGLARVFPHSSPSVDSAGVGHAAASAVDQESDRLVRIRVAWCDAVLRRARSPARTA